MGTPKTQSRPDRKISGFELGNTYVTRGVQQSESVGDIFRCLSRHRRGDWGDMCPEDLRMNEEALSTGARLFSAYQLGNGRKLWVITEAVGDDGRRATTTVLYPDEY